MGAHTLETYIGDHTKACEADPGNESLDVPVTLVVRLLSGGLSEAYSDKEDGESTVKSDAIKMGGREKRKIPLV